MQLEVGDGDSFRDLLREAEVSIHVVRQVGKSWPFYCRTKETN